MTDRFETIQVGDEAEISRVITAADVDAFVTLTGDTNPLHTDEAYAAQTSFQQPVVHGMLTASFISTIIGTKLPGEGALWYEQQLRFIAPVRVGEQIRVWAKVTHKSAAQRIVLLETVVFGEGGRRVIEGQGKVKILIREEPDLKKKS
jgi:3-oxoacyl-[acyl-carrier protein] reductase